MDGNFEFSGDAKGADGGGVSQILGANQGIQAMVDSSEMQVKAFDPHNVTLE